MTWLIILSIISLLIALNALYVAAEFSSVSTRHSRLIQIADEGNPLAEALLPIIRDAQNLDRYIATCQLGITLSSLTLGFYGQSSLADVLAPFFVNIGKLSEVAAQSISATVILLLLTVLQAILGELVPKNIGIQYPEQLALYTSIPTRWSMALFRPLIWFFNGSGQLFMRLLGLTPNTEHTHVHSPEEILMLVEESEAGGLLDQEERRLLINTLQIRDMFVRHVMIPRTRILAASVDQSAEALLSLIVESPYSRMPLYDGNIDNIIGVLHLKDLLCLSYLTEQPSVASVTRPVLFVPETSTVADVLSLLQRGQYYVAVVLDEFGGTAGIVTVEDLLEEIFGEFQDEFETAPPNLRLMSDGRLFIRGDILVKDLNEWLDLYLNSDEVDTIGGLVLNECGSVPKVGDEIQVDTVQFRVEAMDGKGITAISMETTPEQIQRLKDLEVRS
jgi:CBS domain containing-hemolysin-like protein